MSHAQIVICGAGIAGIAAAHRLALHHGLKDIVLVDERSPLSLTSDKSTEAYRNWWPGPDEAMAHFMDRSIDLMEDLAASCANRIERKLNQLDGVEATVNYATEKARVTVPAGYDPALLLAQVEKTGYTATYTATLPAPTLERPAPRESAPPADHAAR